jgi:hypothetical protein
MSQTEERILYCGTDNELYYIIIDKIGTGDGSIEPSLSRVSLLANRTNYKINICNKYVYFVNHIYDVGQEFVKYVKIMIELLYRRVSDVSAPKELYRRVSDVSAPKEHYQSLKKYNKFDLLYDNIMLLDKINVVESNKILKYLKINDLIECKSNLLDTYLHDKIVAKCNFKNNKFILTNNILDEIQYEYEINSEIK